MITVIIPTHNPKIEFLRQTLESIQKQTVKDFEVIVVENPVKTEEVKTLIESFSFNKKHVCSELGANNARNKGAELSSGDVLVFIDDDIILSQTLLEKYEAAHKLYNAGVIGGPVRLRYIDGKPTWMNIHFEGYLAYLDYGTPFGMMPFEVFKEWDLHVPLVSANMSFRKSTFNKLGGFEGKEGYVGRALLAPNDELALLTKCSKKSPGMIFVPDAGVSHLIPKERTSEDYLTRRMYGQGMADFISLQQIHPNLTSLEIYEKILTEHNDLVINDAASYYCLFSKMKRVDRLYATMVYHKGRNEYARGLISQVCLS